MNKPTFYPNDVFYYQVQNFLLSLGSFIFYFNKNKYDLKPGSTFSIKCNLNKDISIDILSLRENLLSNQKAQRSLTISLANSLVVSCYVAIEDKNDRTPIFEFFRHLRNACAHGNCFNFNRFEPRFPSKWRSKIIDDCYKGNINPLHNTTCIGSFIAAGDILHLLYDIQNHIQNY